MGNLVLFRYAISVHVRVTMMLVLLSGTAGSGPVDSEPLNSDRGRVKVVKNENGFTLLADQETALRGGATWIYEWGREGGASRYNSDPKYYASMRLSSTTHAPNAATRMDNMTWGCSISMDALSHATLFERESSLKPPRVRASFRQNAGWHEFARTNSVKAGAGSNPECFAD